jgi:glycosyltransferase involved in cell wall biosynthesis
VNVLQITSDWKWTGPAEPMLRLALALRGRGHEVALAAPPPPPGHGRSLVEEAAAASLAPALLLGRARGLRPLRDRGDVRALRELLSARKIDVVHAWHTRDHLLALRAAGPRRRDGVTALVRSWRRFEAPAATPWARFVLGPGADSVVAVSPRSADGLRRLRGGRAVAGIFGAVDPDRFHAAAPDADGAAIARTRDALGLPPDALVVGIVARLQAHRRFDLLLAAAQRCFAAEPRARLLVVGRGTRRAEIAEEPAKALGIADRVVFAGYRRADYAAVLRAIDVFTFLVPGSDGTCRALLEAQACGVPAVTSRRGALPEIVEHERTGLVVDEDPDALAASWLALLRDPPRRRALGAAAASRAARLFAPSRFAGEMEAVYAEALAARRRGRATAARAGDA